MIGRRDLPVGFAPLGGGLDTFGAPAATLGDLLVEVAPAVGWFGALDILTVRFYDRPCCALQFPRLTIFKCL